MNKELQDKAWAVLPNEFREEVKKFYKECNKEVDDVKTICYSKCFHHIELLVRFFGEHNLTSDVELLSDISQKEPFKVGDKAVVKQGLGKFEVVKIVYYDAEEKTMTEEEFRKLVRIKVSEANLSQYANRITEIISELYMKGVNDGFEIATKIK